jgi:NAD(P)-dependent dehydrogenase (short-subunit alcohol dehydrogenase family)
MKETWFIAGVSPGFGRIWAEAALMSGDNVAATAHKSAGPNRQYKERENDKHTSGNFIWSNFDHR